jgi:hypothetical protein
MRGACFRGELAITRHGGLASDSDQSHEWDTAEKDLMSVVDTTVPVSARIWNYWLTGTLPGTTDCIDADLNKPEEIVRIARSKLDFSQPIAVMIMGVLGHIDTHDSRLPDLYVGYVTSRTRRNRAPCA